MSINWIKTERPDWILEEGTHQGFEYVVMHNGAGYRCGYIKVLHGHPWYAITWEGLNKRFSINVHYGLNFAGYDEEEGYWVGFSCDRGTDKIDLDLVTNESTKRIYKDFAYPEDYQLWTTEMVVDECKRLCEQAGEAV